MTISTDLATPASAMAVAAHPDDVEFGCGGTLAKWASAGCRIMHVVCTDGSKGSWDPAQDTEQLVALRVEEQRAAARALGGGDDVVFLGGTDGELDPGRAMQWLLAQWIRRLKPELVLGHDPWKRYRLHPDHRAAGFLLTDAVVAARDPHFFPEQLGGEEGLAPHRPERMLLWEADEADHVEDITGSFDKKIAALLCHRSQLITTMDIDDAANVAQAEAFVEKMRTRCGEHGALAGVALGEAFKLITRL